jgi:IS66 Orf2 like protein
MRFGGAVIQGTEDPGAGRFRFGHLRTAAERLREGVAVFGIGPATRIYLALGATDMRKGFEGLYGLVRDRLQLEPLSGHVFIFVTCSGDGRGLWI